MKKLKNLLLIIIFSTFLSVTLTGCYDAIELDDEVYALVLGIDKGVNNKIKLTVQYPTYKNGGGGQPATMSTGGKDDSGEVDGTIVSTIETSTILDGLERLNTSAPRKISLTQVKALVFSEDYAREGVKDSFSTMTRFRDTRRNMQVFVCNGNAQEFIKESKSTIGDSQSKAMELLFTQSYSNGYFPNTTLHTFYKNLLSTYDEPVAAYVALNQFDQISDQASPASPPLVTDNKLLAGQIPRKGGNKWELAGTAVFSGDKMVGTLNADETRSFLLVTGKYQKGIMTLEDWNKPGSAISSDIHLGRTPKVKATIQNGVPIINLTLNIEADVGTIQSGIDYDQLSKIEDLNKHLKTYIANRINTTINRTQKEFKSDIFGFGQKVASDFATIQDWENYKWLYKYPNAQVNLSLDVNVRRAGLLLGTSKTS